MINNDDMPRKTNIEIAMELARAEGARRDAAAAATAQADIMHFSTDDIPGIDEIATQYSGVNTADFTHHGQIGVTGNGEPILGETRVYIITEDSNNQPTNASQEKDMNTKQAQPQSEVEAAAQAAAQSAPTGADEAAFNQELSDLIDKGMQESHRMIDDLAHGAGEAAANTLHQESTKEEPAPEPKQSGFKAFFFGLGKKAAAARIKIRKPKEKIELDQEAMLEEVKGLLATAVKHIEDGMSKLPKGTFTPAVAVSNQ